MPQLMLEIGGRSFEVACQPGEEPSLEHAARKLDAEAARVAEAMGRTTEKQMLLLSGLMVADAMSALERQLKATEDRLRMTEERVRQAEAKAAMLAATALKYETEASHKVSPAEVERLRRENTATAELLAVTVDEINTLAEELEAGLEEA